MAITSTLELLPVFDVLNAYNKLEIAKIANENVLICCPFLDHEDTRPSLSVNTITGLWYCHGCDRKGNYKKLFRALEAEVLNYELDEYNPNQLEMQYAISKLELGLDVSSNERVISVQRPHYRKQKRDDRSLFLSQEFFFSIRKAPWDAIQRHYLYTRGFSPRALEHFDVRLNHNSEFSIVIPVYQQELNCGYTSRKAKDCLKSETKYWHSPGMHKSHIVFGNLEPGPVLIVEGPFDMIKAWQFGFHNVCCIFGWHCSDIQAQHILKFATEIICGLDNDDKGEQGYFRLKEVFSTLNVRKMYFPLGIKDVGEMDQQTFSINMYMPAISEQLVAEQRKEQHDVRRQRTRYDGRNYIECRGKIA